MPTPTISPPNSTGPPTSLGLGPLPSFSALTMTPRRIGIGIGIGIGIDAATLVLVLVLVVIVIFTDCFVDPCAPMATAVLPPRRWHRGRAVTVTAVKPDRLDATTACMLT